MSRWHARLWRRARILPGVRLNLSKSGLSWTFGLPWWHLTRGKRGTTETVSLPGTGVRFTRHEPPKD